MKFKTTNDGLLNLDRQNAHLEEIILGLYLKDKISKFNNDNAGLLFALKKRIQDMNIEFLVIKDGKIQTETKHGKESPKLKEPIREREYKEKMKAFLNEEIVIEV